MESAAIPRDVTAPALRTRAEAPSQAKSWTAVQWWGLVGALFTAFWAYVLVKWITGPYFQNVPGGPSELPTYMKISTITWQALAIPIVGLMLYRMLIRPWRRERIVRTEGLYVIALLLLALQDPVSSFFGHWYTYNGHMFNMGAFTNEIPGWQAFGAPGAQQAYPILFMVLAYPGAFFVGYRLAVWAMNQAKKRRPGIGVPALIGVAVGVNMLFDLVLEGFFWCPLGFYTMPGGDLSLFPDTYHKFPFHEMPTVGLLFGLPAALLYFRNDQGETLVERGISKLNVGIARKAGLRLLALVAATQLIYLVIYQIPVGGYVALNPGVWPKDVQQRSYFNNHLCGQGTGRLCPGPGIPLTQDAQVNTRGQLIGNAKPFQLQVTPVINDGGPKPYGGRLIAEESR